MMAKLPRTLLPLFLAFPSLAHAGGKPLPGARHAPPMFVDEAVTDVSLMSRDKGYQFRVVVRIAGMSSKNDRARIDWKQGGRIVATAPCQLDHFDDSKLSQGTCTSPKDDLTAKGAIEADLVATDDATDRDYLVRVYRVNVRSWNEGHGTMLYQVLPDDALGAAWARHISSDVAEQRMAVIDFWMATDKTPGQTNMRCTVDGKRIADIDASIEPLQMDEVTLEQEADHFTGSAHEVHHYEGHQLDWDVAFGPRGDDSKRFEGNRTFLVDHPGHWDCLLRDTSTGKAVRELLFTVDAQGMIEGLPGIATLPNVARIELRIPKDTGLGERIPAGAIAKSMGFGLPWPPHHALQ